MKHATTNDLRCFCARHPLLATYGLDENGKIYIHVKVYKQRRIYGEFYVIGGTIKLHCRDCKRWHEVRIRDRQTADLVVDKVPAPLVAKTDPRP